MPVDTLEMTDHSRVSYHNVLLRVRDLAINIMFSMKLPTTWSELGDMICIAHWWSPFGFVGILRLMVHHS